MSHAPSRPDITEVLVKPGAPLGLWAAAKPDRLAEASKTQGNKKRIRRVIDVSSRSIGRP
jgi:hypothetical protein